MNKRKPRIVRTIVASAALIGLFSLATPRPAHAILGVGEDAPETIPIMPATLTGLAELSPGVPCAGCQIEVVDAPRSATTDANGYYTVRNVPAGMWTLKLSHPSYPTFGTRSFPCGATGNYEFSIAQLCPSVVLTVPGAVSGKLTLPSTSDYDVAVVGIPELGVFTQTSGGGPGYLLTGVAPGWRRIVVRTGSSNAALWVYVQPGQVSMGMNVAVPVLPPLLFQ